VSISPPTYDQFDFEKLLDGLERLVDRKTIGSTWRTYTFDLVDRLDQLRGLADNRAFSDTGSSSRTQQQEAQLSQSYRATVYFM